MQLRAIRNITWVMSLAVLGGCVPGAVHRVEEGDTLIEISHVYGVSLEDILAANHIFDPNHLKTGEKIVIPGVPEARRIDKSVWELEDVAKNVESVETKEDVEVVSSSAPVIKEKTDTKEIRKEPVKSYSGGNQKRLTLIWPVEGKIIFPFGMRNGKMHNGIDLRVRPGALIRAVASGKVVYDGKGIEGYGNIVIVSHGGKLFSVYAYLGNIVGHKGMSVKSGETVGAAMTQPASAFIHFEFRRGKQALDPLSILPRPLLS